MSNLKCPLVITYHYTQAEEFDQQFTDEMRDVTARLREDDFISPRTMRKMGPIIGSVSQIIARGNVGYRAVIKRGKERPLAKQCTTRHAAFEWLVQMSNQRLNG